VLFSFLFYLYHHYYWLVEYEPGILSFILLSIHHLYLLVCFVHCSGELKYRDLQVGQLSSAVSYHMPSLHGNDIQGVPDIWCRIYKKIIHVQITCNSWGQRQWTMNFSTESGFNLAYVPHFLTVL